MQTKTTRLRELTLRYSVRRRADGEPLTLGPALSSPTDSAHTLVALLADEPAEVFGMLCLTTKRRVIGYHEVSRGQLDATLVHPRLCSAQHNYGYVAAAVMWRSRLKASGKPASRSTDAT
jgi:DNA repair protein RadC